MRVFCYFVEPASYTLDLARNIYDKNDIDYCFMNSYTLAKSFKNTKKIFLDKLSLISKLKFIISNFYSHDLIIINGYNNFVFIFQFILNIFSFNKRFIAVDSDTQLSVPRNFFKRSIKSLYLTVVFRSMHVLGFAGGNKSHKELFRFYGMNESRIFLMPMMVDNSKFFQKEKFFPKIFTFLYVGRLVKHKNVEGLIKQFINNFEDKSVVLKIVGTGSEEAYLRNKYVSDKILFLGNLYDINLINEFMNASCFVFPSKFEPWGLVINEALSSGLPVISLNDVGACNDLIKSKDTGLISSDMYEFGNNMLKVYNNFPLLLKYSKKASDFMQNNWNYNFYNKCLLDVIKKVKEWV